jgi:GNAT superfamily N-acetyltransferase
MAATARDRIEIRVSPGVKKLAERASAAMGCTSLTEFSRCRHFQSGCPTFPRETLPVDHKELPSYPVPVTLLARLAVSENYQNRGVGAKTLVTALRQAVVLKDKGLPTIGMVLDVLDEDALCFYYHFDAFHAFSDNPMRLFVPMHVIQQL